MVEIKWQYNCPSAKLLQNNCMKMKVFNLTLTSDILIHTYINMTSLRFTDLKIIPLQLL